MAKVFEYTNTKNSLKRHKKQHSKTPKPPTFEKSNYLCHQCDKTFKTKTGLVLHEKNKHQQIFKYSCAVCHRGFNVKGNYTGHMTGHVEILKEKCKIWGKEYRYKKTYMFILKLNMKTHLTPAKFATRSLIQPML